MQTNKMIEKIINGMNDKIETLENKVEENNNYKKLWEENTKDYNILARKRLSDYESNTELKRDIKVLYQSYDELESKYYSLRSELDGIYSVLEMDALDIQALQDNVFEGFTRDQKNNVNLNKDDINKLIKEVAETDFNDDGTIKEEE